jgi:MurNAc alpha-1-phosphate uridylyltransferase
MIRNWIIRAGHLRKKRYCEFAMKAMILSAGRGERMRPLTDTTPKAMLRAGGQALIEYHLKTLAVSGVSDVVINLAWLGEQLRNYLGNGERYGLNIEYSDEGQSALETGGGIFRALPLLGQEPFWVVNGDVYTDYSFADLTLAAADLGHLVLVANPEHNPVGDFGLAADRVMNTADVKYTYSGIALLRPELFSDQTDGCYPLAPLLRVAADQARLAGEFYPGLWVDAGTPARLAQIDSLSRP